MLERTRLPVRCFRTTRSIRNCEISSSVINSHARGAVSVMVNLSEGQTVEVAMVGRDSLIGTSAALDDGPALADAIVVVPGAASVLKIEDIRAAADRNASLRKLLVRHEQALLVQAQQSAACNASHSVESRLSRLLLRARDLSDSEALPLTQEFLSHMLGVRRATVNVATGMLKKAGFIRYVRGKVTVIDRPGLESASCECYRAITDVYKSVLSGAPRQKR